MKLKIEGIIKDFSKEEISEKSIWRKFTVGVPVIDQWNMATGEETIYELIAFNERSEKLVQFAPGQRVMVMCWLNSKHVQREKFEGYQLSLTLADIKKV